MIVIGGSLGGCEALLEVLRRLPRDFPLPIAAVLHRHRESHDILLPVIAPGSPLPVSEVEDKECAQPGHVYLCPPDYHLMLEEGGFTLSVDEPVNFARPSIDVLFESAAEWERSCAIAVVLSGGGFDGAAGAKRIQQNGGIVLVQDPKTAEGLWMPSAAIAATHTPYVLSLAGIAEALIKLASFQANAR